MFAYASALACALLALRLAITGSRFLLWMPWNLFLAWVPYVLAIGIARLAAHRPLGSAILVLPTVAWLLFFPNAPYVITDFIHLRDSTAGLLAYDALLLGLFAFVSLALGLASLHLVHRMIRRRLGVTAGWTFVATVSLLTGAGVWMGRVLRWNSWDLLANPVGVLQTTVDALLHPVNHLSAIAFSTAFGLVTLGLYALATQRAPQPPPALR